MDEFTIRKRRVSFKQKAKLQRRRFVAVMIFVIMSILFVSSFAIADDGVDSVKVCVYSGDTLWQICEQYKPENTDVRDFIVEVKCKNKLKSSAVEAGQILYIPVR